MFNELKGIAKARAPAPRSESALEALITLGRRWIGNVGFFFGTTEIADDREGVVGKRNRALYTGIKKIAARKLPPYTPQDLVDYIISTETEDNCSPESLGVRGIYTGALLSLLTERNRARGVETCIEIDGAGRNIDYLFLFAQNVDTLVLKNVSGDYILAAVGSNRGYAKTVVMHNVSGDSTAFGLAQDGRLDRALFSSCSDTFYLSADVAINGGSAGMLSYVDCTAVEGWSLSSADTKINTLVAIDQPTFNSARAETIILCGVGGIRVDDVDGLEAARIYHDGSPLHQKILHVAVERPLDGFAVLGRELQAHLSPDAAYFCGFLDRIQQEVEQLRRNTHV